MASAVLRLIRWGVATVLAVVVVLALAALVYFKWVPFTVWLMADRWNAASSAPRLGLAAYRATIQAHVVKGIDRNLSGLAYNPDRDTLFAVINHPPAVAELTLDGTLLRLIPLATMTDTEGIAYLGDGLLAIADEADNHLHWLRIQADGTAVELPDLTRLELGFQPLHNNGLEGLAWDAAHSRFLAANEQWPRRVLEVAVDHPPLDAGRYPVQVWRPRSWFGALGNDLASVEVDPRTGNVLLLSEESAILTEYSATGAVLGVMPLWAGRHGLDARIPKPEGMTVGPDGTLYVVSEPNLFYRFEKLPRRPQ